MNRSESKQQNDASANQVRLIRSVLLGLRHWWKLAVPCGLLLSFFAALPVYLIFEPVYESSTWLRIQDRPPSIVFDREGASQQFVKTQIEMIRSPLVIADVLSQPEVADMPELNGVQDRAKELTSRINIASVGNSELYKLTYTGSSAEGAATVANAVAKSYLRLQRESEDEHLQVLMSLLEKERARWENVVRDRRAQVRLLAKQTATGDVEASDTGQGRLQVNQPLVELQKQLVSTEVERTLLEVRIKAYGDFEKRHTVAPPAETVQQAIANHPRVQELRQSVAEKEAKRDAVDAASANPGASPIVQRLNEEISRSQSQLKSLLTQLNNSYQQEMQQSLSRQRSDELDQLQIQLAGYETLQEVLHQRLEEELSKIQQTSGDTLDLEFARAEMERAEQVFQMIAQRSLQVNTERAAPERVSLWDEAKPPVQPREQLPFKKLLLAGLAGLWLPLGLAVAWEFFHQRIDNSRQLTVDSELLVLGEIADLPHNGRRLLSRSGRAERRLRMFEESIDNLRTCLVLSEPLQEMQVLAVTSAISGEGKTSTATQLTLSLARATKEPILLIDADVRAPDLHHVFQLAETAGLVDVLSGQALLESAVQSINERGIDVLTAGKYRGNPHELFGNGAVGRLVEQSRKTYRYVVVDTPPVLAASEALVLARSADATLICVRRGHSRMDQVRVVHERLLMAGARPLGATLIGVPSRHYAYRYGTYA